MFKVEFATDGHAFKDEEGNPDPSEVTRILRVIAGKVDDYHTGGSILDANGNNVGTWKYSK